MVSRRFHASHLHRSKPVGHKGATPFHGHRGTQAGGFDLIRPLRTAEGKANYRLLAGLVVLILVMGALMSYRGWFGGKRQPRVVAVHGDDRGHVPHRYKIQKPPSPTMMSGPRESGPGTGIMESRPDAAPLDASGPVGAEPKGPVPSPDPESSAGQALSEEAPAASATDVAVHGREMAVAPSLGPPTHSGPDGRGPAAEPPPKLFFVKAGVANVRDGPTMKGRSLALARKGCSVKVTGQEKEWYQVQLDDGRSGWVHHTLLSVVPDSPKEGPAGRIKIETIRVEPPLGQKTRVFFRSSAPVVPEIQVLEGDSPRVVVDFPGATTAPDLGDRMTVNNGMIHTIRVGRHERPRVRLRVVLDLEPGPRYEAGQVASGNEQDVWVEIRGSGKP